MLSKLYRRNYILMFLTLISRWSGLDLDTTYNRLYLVILGTLCYLTLFQILMKISGHSFRISLIIVIVMILSDLGCVIYRYWTLTHGTSNDMATATVNPDSNSDSKSHPISSDHDDELDIDLLTENEVDIDQSDLTTNTSLVASE